MKTSAVTPESSKKRDATMNSVVTSCNSLSSRQIRLNVQISTLKINAFVCDFAESNCEFNFCAG